MHHVYAGSGVSTHSQTTRCCIAPLVTVYFSTNPYHGIESYVKGESYSVNIDVLGSKTMAGMASAEASTACLKVRISCCACWFNLSIRNTQKRPSMSVVNGKGHVSPCTYHLSKRSSQMFSLISTLMWPLQVRIKCRRRKP